MKSETQASEESSGYVSQAADEPTESYAEGEWVTNPETGAMEWHAADGSVVSQEQWAAATDQTTDESK